MDSVVDDLELLDTPGMLWPKFENQQTGLNWLLPGPSVTWFLIGRCGKTFGTLS